ncbi:MAG: aldehyde ferredoxin oxidoreductase C-terminal domain-containing protein [Anaerolineae bacterium]|jgi:aldehyde:ferredoxin oxidoreductase
MKRRVVHVDPATGRWQLETLDAEALNCNPHEDYGFLSGESLCQFVLRRTAQALVIARGPMPFLSGNKATVGYVSPLTGVPHYSFVGGRAAAQILNLGLDAIVLERGVLASGPSTLTKPAGRGEPATRPYELVGQPPIVLIEGRAPNLTVAFRPAFDLPTGQRSAYYRLVEEALDGALYAGSIFTVGEGAWWGYRTANLAVDAIYHAGRGGAGAVFARYASALVLWGDPVDPTEVLMDADAAFARNPNTVVDPLLSERCARLSSRTGGTITKLYRTGALSKGQNTLPTENGQRVSYPAADLGSRRVLKATRDGQTGCHWCQVDCRHYHWVDVDYAPGGRDLFLDDFEPAYATFAVLNLMPDRDSFQARLDLRAKVDRRLILPIEQMGCDVIDVGAGLAALLEGLERGLIPVSDVPDVLSRGAGLGKLGPVTRAVAMLRAGDVGDYPALRAVADGPQALARAYPAMGDLVFTGGSGTLGNAGHANALWTFLMPFSRFFGHYVGQYYKIDEELPSPGSDAAAYHACFERVVERMLQREFFWILGNALSMCAFTFVIFSQDGAGERLSDDLLLVRLLRRYGISTTRADLEWFAQAFWAQSMDLKTQFGWQPPSAADLPRRVYEALSLALGRTPEELESLMAMLIAEWEHQAREVMSRFGYVVMW